jgi:hypothetical protein
MHAGYPVYFVVFYPEPAPGQTMADVLHALRRFVEEVSKRHQGKPPVLYGNCQAGWVIAILAAEISGRASGSSTSSIRMWGISAFSCPRASRA